MAWTELGRRVKDERCRRGMSAEALGRASGMTAQTVANVESGDHCPLVATLSKLAEAMDMRAEDLLVAEPGFVVLGFELPAYRDLGDVASLEDRVKHDVVALTGVDPRRVAVFPWLMHEVAP